MNKIRVRNNNHINENVLKSIDRLRVNMNFVGNDKKVIAVTSASDREGKSFVAYQLACMEAVHDKKVILLHLDFRKNIGNKKNNLEGIAQVVDNKADVSSVMYKTDIRNMYMMFAGATADKAMDVVENPRFEKLINWLKIKFDYVIIDTATIGKGMDSTVICSKCDGAILVTESGAVPYKKAQNAIEQIRMAECEVIGAVINNK